MLTGVMLVLLCGGLYLLGGCMAGPPPAADVALLLPMQGEDMQRMIDQVPAAVRADRRAGDEARWFWTLAVGYWEQLLEDKLEYPDRSPNPFASIELQVGPAFSSHATAHEGWLEKRMGGTAQTMRERLRTIWSEPLPRLLVSATDNNLESSTVYLPRERLYNRHIAEKLVGHLVPSGDEERAAVSPILLCKNPADRRYSRDLAQQIWDSYRLYQSAVDEVFLLQECCWLDPEWEREYGGDFAPCGMPSDGEPTDRRRPPAPDCTQVLVGTVGWYMSERDSLSLCPNILLADGVSSARVVQHLRTLNHINSVHYVELGEQSLERSMDAWYWGRITYEMISEHSRQEQGSQPNWLNFVNIEDGFRD